MASCLKCILYTSLNAHFFAVRKDNLFKFLVIVHISLVFLSVQKTLLIFIAIRSLLSDLGPYVLVVKDKDGITTTCSIIVMYQTNIELIVPLWIRLVTDVTISASVSNQFITLFVQ